MNKLHRLHSEDSDQTAYTSAGTFSEVTAYMSMKTVESPSRCLQKSMRERVTLSLRLRSSMVSARSSG